MPKFFVTIKIPNKKDKKVTIKTDRILMCEDMVVTEYLSKLPEYSTARINGDGETCFITKDKTKKHWNHDGYVFTG